MDHDGPEYPRLGRYRFCRSDPVRWLASIPQSLTISGGFTGRHLLHVKIHAAQHTALAGGAAILVACTWLGNFTSSSLSLPIPGSVIGMLMLLVILVFNGGAPAGLAKVSSQLLYLLPLLLLPAAVGVFFSRA
ncbi:CidA/LrgA family protein [Microbulbifer sp. VAAF005]|uniref:CidA/LrgA family protein n=1 Tax=Microbulbifer sp. VAAF005 TaxID=3034230 RepID=UPI0024AC99D6|nr:CidA/LrgA family protein [Microbulbifer sp. VAAF005]WHI44954.1 CidA/LrgA family protein [Microbulbifer sp. VAAF005]